MKFDFRFGHSAGVDPHCLRVRYQKITPESAIVSLSNSALLCCQEQQGAPPLQDHRWRGDDMSSGRVPRAEILSVCHPGKLSG